MLFGKTLLAGACLAVMAVSGASAQSYGGGLRIEGPVYQRAIPISPDAIFEALERAGYREFGPMAPREPVYKLSAVNPRGDLVALQISMFTGEIQQEAILQRRYRPPLQAYRPAPEPQVTAAPPPVRPAPAPRAGGGDPLVVY